MKFKEFSWQSTDDFFYDLLDDSYIKPEDPEEIKEVRTAMEVLTRFKDSAEEQEVLQFF